jgi:TatD DNase family protein
VAVFYDTHAHLDYPEFAAELPEVVRRAEGAGITRIVSIGTTLQSSQRAIRIAEKFPNVYAAVGWHPSYVMDAPADIRPSLREMAKHPRVVALGETGLDYHRLPSSKPESATIDDSEYKRRQHALFTQHMEVAAQTGLNCVIHQRNSLEDTIRALESFASKIRGVFHCFYESIETMRRIVEMGSLVSFTGIITFKNAQNIRECVAAASMGKFMLETDCPFLAPVPFRGKRCEPAYVKEISEVVMQAKNVSEEELSKATCATAEEFFRFR